MENNLNIDLSNLLKQVNGVVEKEVNNILKDYSEKFRLYEETYNAVMKVVNYSSNKEEVTPSIPVSSEENVNLKDIISCIKSTIQDEIKPIHHEINNLKTSYEQQNNKINSLSEELHFVKNLNQVVSDLKIELACLKNEIGDIKKPVLKENIDINQ